MAGDTVLVDPGNDDPATTPGGPAPHQAHDGARRLRRRSAVSAREEAAPLLLVAIGRWGKDDLRGIATFPWHGTASFGRSSADCGRPTISSAAGARFSLPLRNRLSTSGEVIAWRPGAKTSHISSRHAQQCDCHPPASFVAGVI